MRDILTRQKDETQSPGDAESEREREPAEQLEAESKAGFGPE
jgi:hypothetical protein